MVEANAPAVPAAEDESASVSSRGDGESSGDDVDVSSPRGPASSAAGNKRKRVKYQKTSCELCKARKVKCDRAEPACSWCARHNRSCVYLERQKPGSRIGFALELESKVNRVDALLQTLWRRVEDHIAYDHHQPPPPAGTLASDVAGRNPSHLDGYLAPSESIPPPRSAGLQSSTPPMAQGRTSASFPTPPWQGSEPADGQAGAGAGAAASSVPPPPPTSDPPPAAAAAAAGDSVHATSYVASHMPRGQAGTSSSAAGADLPPHDIIYTLVDLYFKHCNTWCPILDRKTTFGIFFGSTSQGEADRILLHAIVATTLRFLKDPRLPAEMKSHHHSVSRNTVMMYAMENVSVAALKALVILSLDELGTSNGPRGWNLLSLLAQNVRQLELCDESSVHLSVVGEDAPRVSSIRNVTVGRPASWIEDEGRRRLCWMVYLLDRYATIATTFDFMLDDRKMRRVLPCSYDLFSRNVPVDTTPLAPMPDQQRAATSYAVGKSEHLGSFSYHCEILRILSRVHEFLQAPIDVASSADLADWRTTYRSLDAALDNWLQSLPSEYSRISALCHSDPASRVANWFVLHSAYVTSVVRLHSSAAYPTAHSPIFVPSHYAMHRCLSAVQSLRDITQDVYEANGLNLVGPPFAFSLWVAGRLLLVHAATARCPVDPKIDFFIGMLEHVGQYWEVANNYARILARVVRRGRQGDMSFTTMRKSAYDLACLTATSRRSGLEESASRSVSLSELDNLDVFDFFHYPKVPEPVPSLSSGLHQQRQQGVGGEAIRSSALPDPESDWLGYGSPYS
ncbi:hypothetical protein RJ55_03663 [Drechmeria coniospora]|nr:hypothetical protein RJ55_03663 [Drechmeria coniospora]